MLAVGKDSELASSRPGDQEIGGNIRVQVETDRSSHGGAPQNQDPCATEETPLPYAYERTK